MEFRHIRTVFLVLALSLAAPTQAHDLIAESLLVPDSVGMEKLETHKPDQTYACDAKFRDQVINTFSLNTCLLMKAQNCLFAAKKSRRGAKAGLTDLKGKNRTKLKEAGAAGISTGVLVTRLQRNASKEVVRGVARALPVYVATALEIGLILTLPATIVYDLLKVHYKNKCYKDPRFVDEHIDYEASWDYQCVPSFGLTGPSFLAAVDDLLDEPDRALADLQSHPLSCEFLHHARNRMAESIDHEMALRSKISMTSVPSCSNKSGSFSYEVRIRDEKFRVTQEPSTTRYEALDSPLGKENYLLHNTYIGSLLVPEQVEWTTKTGVVHSYPIKDFMSPMLAIPQREMIAMAMRYATITTPVVRYCCESDDRMGCFADEFPELEKFAH